MRRLAIVIVPALALAVPAGLVAPQCAAATGEVTVTVIIDFGDVPGGPHGPSVACVPVAEDATGTELLAARARQLGTPPPRYDASGLLCAIDGLPVNGCGEATADGYRYWSYWHGHDDGWRYASIGPGGSAVDPGVTEGWRFVDGAGSPDDPPPRHPPAAECPDGVAVQADAGRGADAPAPGPGATTEPAVSFGAVVGAALAGSMLAGGVVIARRRGTG